MTDVLAPPPGGGPLASEGEHVRVARPGMRRAGCRTGMARWGGREALRRTRSATLDTLHRQGRLHADGGGHDRGGSRRCAVAVPGEIPGPPGARRRRGPPAPPGGPSPAGAPPPPARPPPLPTAPRPLFPVPP